MSCYFEVKSQSQRTSESIVLMCCFLMFGNSNTNKMKEEHQQVIEEKDNQIQAHQQKVLRLNEEIDDVIKKQARSTSWIFWQRVMLHQKE